LSKEEAVEVYDAATQALLDRYCEDAGGTDDIVMGGIPRITINHKGGVWVASQTMLEVPSFEGVVTGFQQQRVLWHPDQEKQDPLCKSHTGKVGWPRPAFPLSESRVTLTGPIVEDETEIACDLCQLKEWGSNPKGESSWCTEQIALIIRADIGDTGTALDWVFSAQRSAMKPTKKLNGAFRGRGKLPFQQSVKFTLSNHMKGTSPYSVPVYTIGEDTNPLEHGSYIQSYLAVKEKITTKFGSEGPESSDIAVVPRADDIAEF